VATAAGSTGAMKSAGGKVLPLDSDKRQYMPRELYEAHDMRYRLKGGVINPDKKFSVICQMHEAYIYVDGAHKRISFKYGDKLEVRNDELPLRVIL
jgi:NAD+ kinase